MAMVGLESTDESALSGKIDPLRPRAEYEKSTQTTIFVCPYCSGDLKAVFQLDRKSRQHQNDKKEKQTQVSSMPSDETPIAEQHPTKVPKKPLTEERTHFEQHSGYHQAAHEGRTKAREQPNPKYVDKQSRCQGQYSSELSKTNLLTHYHKKYTSYEPTSWINKELSPPASDSSTQKPSNKHDQYTAATELDAPRASCTPKQQRNFRKVLTVPLTKNQIPVCNRKQVLFSPSDKELHPAVAEEPTPKLHKYSNYLPTDTKIAHDVSTGKVLAAKQQANDKPKPMRHFGKSKVLAPRQRHATKASQLIDPCRDRTAGNNSRCGKASDPKITRTRNKFVDDLFLFKRLNCNSTPSASSSIFRSINDDMAKLYDLYATGSSETTQAVSGSRKEPPKKDWVEERHHLPSLGLPSPVKDKPVKSTLKKVEARQDLSSIGGLQLTAQDIIDTKVTAPMIRRVQRIYRANLAEQMMLVQELDSIPKLVKDMLENYEEN